MNTMQWEQCNLKSHRPHIHITLIYDVTTLNFWEMYEKRLRANFKRPFFVCILLKRPFFLSGLFELRCVCVCVFLLNFRGFLDMRNEWKQRKLARNSKTRRNFDFWKSASTTNAIFWFKNISDFRGVQASTGLRPNFAFIQRLPWKESNRRSNINFPMASSQ